MASLEMSTPAENWPLPASDQAKQDTAVPAPPVPITPTSHPDENEAEEPDQSQANEIKDVDKGKGKNKKKHGVMSLPAEIRETYATVSSLHIQPLLLDVHSTDLNT